MVKCRVQVRYCVKDLDRIVTTRCNLNPWIGGLYKPRVTHRPSLSGSFVQRSSDVSIQSEDPTLSRCKVVLAPSGDALCHRDLCSLPRLEPRSDACGRIRAWAAGAPTALKAGPLNVLVRSAAHDTSSQVHCNVLQSGSSLDN